MEREQTLNDILIVMLKKAKCILICTLICGILLAGYAIISCPTADNATNDSENYDSELHIAEDELARSQQREKALNDYKMNSPYYSIDPYNVANCTIQFLVDTGFKINPNLTYQNPDPTSNVASAYTMLYRFDREIMQHVVELLGGGIEEKYAAELIKVTSSSGNIVKISVVYTDAETASEIASYIFDATKSRINDTVMEHSTMMISDSAVYCIDDDIREKQEAVDKELVTVLERIAEDEKALDALQVAPIADRPLGILKTRLIKFTVLGFALGAFAGCCIAVFGLMLGNRLSSTSDVARYDFPMLGSFSQKSKKRWFDGWIRKLENDPLLSREAAIAVLTANLNAVASGKRIALVGTCKRAVLDNLAEKLGEFVFAAGNVIEDASAVEALNQADSVLLVEMRGESQLQQLDQLVQRLKTLDKKIIGIVLG